MHLVVLQTIRQTLTHECLITDAPQLQGKHALGCNAVRQITMVLWVSRQHLVVRVQAQQGGGQLGIALRDEVQ